MFKKIIKPNFNYGYTVFITTVRVEVIGNIGSWFFSITKATPEPLAT